MIVTCPSCETRFSVPESALGPRGRMLRCARCGHKWHQDPPTSRAEEIPLEVPPAETPRAALAEHLLEGGDGIGGRLDEDHDEDHDEHLVGGFSLDSRGNATVNFGSVPAESEGEDRGKAPAEAEEDDPFAKISELMMARPPEPIPDVFATPVAKAPVRRKGAAVLWLLLVVLLLASSAAAVYFLQDRIMDRWPETARYYDQFGLRNEVVGAGLAFRNYNSERLVQNDAEVLIVRGVIANTTDQSHEIPLLRLALYNNQALLQEKIISPPQTSLDARATVGFRITLDQPDANATRFEVTFTSPKPPEGTAADPKAEAKPAEARAPDAKAPEAKPADTKAPDAKVPDAKAPDAKPADSKAPGAKAPEAKPADAKAPPKKS